MLATNTWNAYNNWGGRSLYTGGNEVSFQRPWGRGMLVRPEVERDDRKSPPRRPGEEPDIDGEAYQAFRYAHGFPGYMGSAGWFTYDRRFAEWAERAGLELDYAISSDLEQVDGLTDGYRLVIGAGHDEYWSAAGRDAIEQFVDRRRQLRLVLRQHDVLAGAARARRHVDGVPQVLGADHRSDRRPMTRRR